MKTFSIFAVLATICYQNVSAATWYFLRWNTPSSSAQFTKFSTTMIAPALKQKGTYYLWPGLQDTANTGVYQEVLDGRSGTWWIGGGWCCSNPSLSWGSGFNVNTGAVMDISMTKTDTTNWTSSVTSGGQMASNAFPLSSKNFNQAILAIELTGVTWDFGELVWENVVMVMSGTTSTSWCTSAPENYSGTTSYNSTTPKASVSGSTVTCTIDKVVFIKPAK